MKCTKCQAEWTPPRDRTVTVCPFCGEPLLDLKKIDKNTELHEILAMIVKQQGTSIIGERVLKGMLGDYLPNLEKKFKNILGKALDDRIGQQLLELGKEEDSERNLKVVNLRESFKAKNGFDSTADYVIDSFLYALRWIDEVEVRQQRQNIDTLTLLNKQVEIAFADGSLKKEEAISLFESARLMGISDENTADAIENKIKELKLYPNPAEGRNMGSRENKIISRDWTSRPVVEEQQGSASCENKYILQLADKIQDLRVKLEKDGKYTIEERNDRISELIRNFPVPDSEEDLVSLLYFIGPKAKYGPGDDPYLIKAWRIKFEEVSHRLRFVLKDSEFTDYFNDMMKATFLQRFYYGMDATGKLGFWYWGTIILVFLGIIIGMAISGI
ncbi:MAG: hypothetical protein JXN62_13370 [Bacteroidales bacterium]|nr:hypothetical protein [Bacteroidales bacterium]